MGYIDTNSSKTRRMGLNKYVDIDFEFSERGYNLIVGNVIGFFGHFTTDRYGMVDLDLRNTEVLGNDLYNRLDGLITAIDGGAYMHVLASDETIDYWRHVLAFICRDGRRGENKERVRKVVSHVSFHAINPIERDMTERRTALRKMRADGYNGAPDDVQADRAETEIDVYIRKMRTLLDSGFKYDYIFSHTPYMKSGHLGCLEIAFELMTPNGRFTSINPAQYLINLRDNIGEGRKYVRLRTKLNGHVFRADIENINDVYGNTNYTPYSIIYIDNGVRSETIDFRCCGHRSKVSHIDDCNLIGNRYTIRSILDKCASFRETADSHVFKYKTAMDSYAKRLAKWRAGKAKAEPSEPKMPYRYCCMYATLYGQDGGTMCGLETSKHKYDKMFQPTPFGEYISPYSASGVHYIDDGIYDHPIGNDSLICADTVEELENWRDFCRTSRLFMFIAICTNYDNHNMTQTVMPWLVDRRYTDDERYAVLGITPNEANFIDYILKKFEKGSPWFQRYIRGRDRFTDDEVESFIKDISIMTEDEIIYYMRSHGYEIGAFENYSAFAVYGWLREMHGVSIETTADGRARISFRTDGHVTARTSVCPLRFGERGACDITEVLNTCFEHIAKNDLLGGGGARPMADGSHSVHVGNQSEPPSAEKSAATVEEITKDMFRISGLDSGNMKPTADASVANAMASFGSMNIRPSSTRGRRPASRERMACDCLF